jgi:hypothetical protein
VATGLVVALAAGGSAAAWRAGAFRSSGQASATPAGPPPPATRPVTRQDLASRTPVTATLGYAESYNVAGRGGGTLTWLPSAGQEIRQGHVLYRVDNGVPVVLLYGNVPDWRAMSDGDTGADVRQLNHDLVALKYASSADISALGWDYYSWATASGVEKLQAALGVSSPTGSLSLGAVVFEPEALRIATVQGSLGGQASGPVLTATSDRHQVTIALDASQQGEVKAGDAVSVTLPDGVTTPGRITKVGTVATAPGNPQSGSDNPATVPVYVNLTRRSEAGTLDQAPVTVNITTASAHGALVVPVGALLAQTSGGYAVEVVGAGSSRHLVPVQPGIFDDDSELVQVTGALTPGQHVVVPSS